MKVRPREAHDHRHTAVLPYPIFLRKSGHAPLTIRMVVMALPQNPNVHLPLPTASKYLKERLGDASFPSVATLNAWRWQGRGPKYLKFGIRIFYRQLDLDGWLDQHLVDPEARGA